MNDVQTSVNVQNSSMSNGFKILLKWSTVCVAIIGCSFMFISIASSPAKRENVDNEPLQNRNSYLSSDFPPFSVEDPKSFGISYTSRSAASMPGEIFGSLLTRNVPIPTNMWCENLFFGARSDDESNKVFQIPYVVDAAGPIVGIRTHSTHLKGTDRSIVMEIEGDTGITLGAVEDLAGEHITLDQGSYITHVAVELKWTSISKLPSAPICAMQTPIVRGSPYISMEYIGSTPRIVAESLPRNPMVVDIRKKVVCGTGSDVSNAEPFTVTSEIAVTFENDHTWLIFVSKPIEFRCFFSRPPPGGGQPFIPGVVPSARGPKNHFELVASEPLAHGMVRVALANNCTHGTNAVDCQFGKPKDAVVASVFADLLREHSNIYASRNAHVSVAMPSGILVFNWKPLHMSDLALDAPKKHGVYDGPELLMFALPHHQDQILPQIGSSNEILEFGCVPTLQGQACPVKGGKWLLQETLPKVNFGAPRPIRKELKAAILSTIEKDLAFEMPLNYRRGAGDTYFSGKMLSKLARTLLIAEELGYRPNNKSFAGALSRLRAGTEIWINGSARSQFVYDPAWGGLISCGCNYDGEHDTCFNEYPECPALTDAGQNFGNGFYNDHHFHYGYHIHAAAVIMKYDNKWGREFYERVLLLVRDIANPSHEDPYFPTWRHKDWYLGSSWASGIVTTQSGQPFPNGRNEESSAEAIFAYEAVALFGVSAKIMFNKNTVPGDLKRRDNAYLIEEMGRLLLTTEVKSAQRYWQVRAPAIGVRRVYPETYKPKVVGMLWSMLAEEQTWFGNQQWKSYGIQVLTISPASELRDDVEWVAEMLPLFNASCSSDPVCKSEGWSILVNALEATVCRWQSAADAIMALPDTVFSTAGGNGQSRSNSLWYIATRPCA